MNVKRIAISGKMCSGKSTITQYLVEHYGFVERSFALKLKSIVEDLFDVKTKDREMLQLVGEKMRQIDSYVWVRYLFRDMPSDKNIVVSDVRYLNEIVTLKEGGFVTIRVEIDEKIQRERYKKLYDEVSNETFYHVSEIALDDYDGFDYVLDGAMSKDNLLEAVDNIIGELELEGDV